MRANPMTPKRTAVLTVLQQADRPLRPSEVAAATGMKPRNVGMTLLRMEFDGDAKRIARGLWRPATGA